MGEGLGSCTLEEIQQVEQQLEKSVCTIRDRKVIIPLVIYSNNVAYRDALDQVKALTLQTLKFVDLSLNTCLRPHVNGVRATQLRASTPSS